MMTATKETNQNNSDIFKKAQSYSLRLLSIKLRTEKELKEKLFQKSYPNEIIDQLIDKLIQSKLIDDERFASLWIENRKNLKNKSTYVIRQELKIKGVSEEIINNALSKGTTSSDLESAKKLLERKSHLFSKKTGRDKTLKQQQFLARNGFSWDVIKKVTKEDE